MTLTALLITGLVVVAMMFYFFELLTPSFGIMTALGTASFGTAIFLGFRTSTVLGIFMVAAFVIGVPAYFAMLIRVLPRSSAGRKLFLRKTGNDTSAGVPELTMNMQLVGKTGVAETQLRPSGAVRIEGRRVIGLAESGIIDKGSTVKVIDVSGSNIIVRAVGESKR